MLIEDLKKQCNAIANPISEERLNDAIDKIVKSGCLNLDNADERIVPTAIMAAIFDDMKRCCLKGSLNVKTQRKIQREYNNIKCFIPLSY